MLIKFVFPISGDASLPLSMEALDHAVGYRLQALDARRRWCGVRWGLMPLY